MMDMNMMGDGLNMQQQKAFMKNFQKMSGGTGQIPMSDMLKLTQLSGFNPTQKQMRNTIDSNDLSNADMFSFDDCQKIINNIGYKANENVDESDDLRKAFEHFDKDNSGYLDSQEFREAMLSHGEDFTEEETDELMNQFDKTGDGRISYKEFIAAMKQQMNNIDDEDGGEGMQNMQNMMGGNMMGGMMGGMMNMANQQNKRGNSQRKNYQDEEQEEEGNMDNMMDENMMSNMMGGNMMGGMMGGMMNMANQQNSKGNRQKKSLQEEEEEGNY